MAKRSKKRRHFLEYQAARLVVFILSHLPLAVAAWLGRRLADIMRLLDRRHRQRALEQSRERLGLTDEEARRFVRQNFHSYGMTLAEFSHLSRMRQDDFHRYADLDPITERIRSLLAEGRGVVLITAHFGNWEWCNSMANAMGVEGGSIARPLDNARLNEYVRQIRERNGLKILDKQGAIRKALGLLRENRAVGVLIDQDAGRNGMMSPFLGRPASTITIPVELAIRTGSPLLPVVLRRGGSDKRFSVLFTPEPHRPVPGRDAAGETRRLVDALNSDLGGLIMQAPEQWFWIHRRWKSVGEK